MRALWMAFSCLLVLAGCGRVPGNSTSLSATYLGTITAVQARSQSPYLRLDTFGQGPAVIQMTGGTKVYVAQSGGSPMSARANPYEIERERLVRISELGIGQEIIVIGNHPSLQAMADMIVIADEILIVPTGM